ncbi:glucose 1-dehydrogenase [Microscilla marina]|uniref:3-oxoacyl-acyl-carrier-protein reductase n=1 Tax=Microscilla marina ATCC 23134 TaxID=313606 RepID=A1ZKI7_MICM2|nr:glucose 1-dehydrogenase [Microscilla marina]EAY29213.1 3-oxoacyl-acyl-carrier-protein reductase [Microscilla marina ATCC 23134]
MSKLEGKVAIITGATSGMGLATAKLFLAEGAKVVVTGRSDEKLKATNEELAKIHANHFLTIKADAADVTSNKKVFEAAQDKFGKVDILFANAGVGRFMPLSDVTEAMYDEVMNTNLKGPFFLVQAGLPYFNEGASIILNTSVSNQMGMPGASAYAASKAGLRLLARVFAAELSAHKIRVNAISPGPIDTPIWGKTGLPEEAVQEMGAGIASQVALGRFGTSEEIAKSVLFLASQDASFVTGIELEVDGGMSQV